MKWIDWLKKWKMTSLKININFLEMEWIPSSQDKDAAWDLYIELITRITTQELFPKFGDEKQVLESIYSIFGLTRDILKTYKRQSIEFSKIAIVVLNQVIRPFTTKWHKIYIDTSFKDESIKLSFRHELKDLQNKLHIYSNMLADMAGIEDITSLEG